MHTYKEFQGKTLDDAIKEACEYFGVAREKLEVEIINDAKTGIFGLVGVKKATIRAARVQTAGAMLSADAEPENVLDAIANEDLFKTSSEVPATPAKNSRRNDTHRNKQRPSDDGEQRHAPQGKRNSKRADAERGDAEATTRPDENTRDARPARQQALLEQPRPAPMHAPTERDDSSRSDEFPEYRLEGCDEAHLFATVSSVVQRLILPIVGDAPCSVEINGSRVRVVVDCGEASGLLVGREGQTLASVQFLAARILAKELGGSIRLRIDAGNYRERQEDKLKEMALALADRARATRRSQSTRPLSAYQRRIVHLALQEDETVLTQSKGEGPQRRVIILLKRSDSKNVGRTYGRRSSDAAGSSNALSDSDTHRGGEEAPVEFSSSDGLSESMEAAR